MKTIYERLEYITSCMARTSIKNTGDYGWVDTILNVWTVTYAVQSIRIWCFFNNILYFDWFLFRKDYFFILLYSEIKYKHRQKNNLISLKFWIISISIIIWNSIEINQNAFKHGRKDETLCSYFEIIIKYFHLM
jgi:hypothetical protein